MKRTSCRILTATFTVVLFFGAVCDRLFALSSGQASIYTLDGRCVQASPLSVDRKGLLRLQGDSDHDAIPLSASI